MKKHKCLRIVLACLSVFLFMQSASAKEYAYSVGSKWATGTAHAGDDFTKNVDVAADAYGWLSGYTSYYNYNPTYSYMSGSNGSINRLGGSSVYFINGHANSQSILVAGSNTTNNRTGIHISNNGTTVSEGGLTFKLAGLNGRNMNNTKLITFAGCSTAKASSNLPSKAVSQGAKSAVGFKGNIISRFNDGPNWLKKYNYTLGNGVTVARAIEAATTAYPNDTLSQYVTAYGNTNTRLGTLDTNSLTSAIYKDSSISEMIIPIEDEYKSISYDNISVYINPTIKSFSNQKLSSFSNTYNTIIEAIKREDSSFDINKYKVSYNLVNEEENYGFIFFTYFIGDVETNKVYLATIRDNKLTNLMLAGVKEKNIINIDNINNNELKNTITKFENNKGNKLMSATRNKNIFTNANILNSDKTIKVSSFNNNVTSYDEKYYYDFNTNSFQYILNVYHTIDGLTDGESISISLN